MNFVCDITVVEAGKSDQYILKPQIAQSEVGQKFKEMKQAGKPVKLGEDEEEELEIELEEDEEQPEEFEGIITAISENEENASPWTMTLEGVEGQVTVYVTKLEGTPAVYAEAEVEGVLKDNTIEEARAEVEEE